MAISPVSFLGQSQAQAGRLKNINAMMADLQRQLTTQKKTDTYSGLGASSLSVQKYRMDMGMMKTYSSNVDTAITRIDLMTKGIERASASGREVLSAMKTKIGNQGDLDAIRLIATQSLPLLRDVANLDADGRYLFSGSNTTVEPLASNNNINTIASSAWADWKAGTISTSQLLSDLGNLTPQEMGFDPALSTSGDVSVNVDGSMNVSYTSVADKNGLQNTYMITAMMANFTGLDPATDVPNETELQDLMNGMIDLLQKGVTDLEVSASELGTKYDLLDTVQQNHRSDKALLEKIVSEKEDVDTAEVAVQIQALQTQLNASYQVTAILSQLTLVNYL